MPSRLTNRPKNVPRTFKAATHYFGYAAAAAAARIEVGKVRR